MQHGGKSRGVTLRHLLTLPVELDRTFLESNEDHSLPKTTYTQQWRDKNRLAKKESPPLNMPLSPSSTYPQHQAKCRKRKRAHTWPSKNDSPPVKQWRPSRNDQESPSVFEDCTSSIAYWSETGHWPPNFAERGFDMGDSRDPSHSNKRPRQSSYSQTSRDRKAPESYSPAYETYILAEGLDMNIIKGEELVSKQSKSFCEELQKISHQTIEPGLFDGKIVRKVVALCRKRNEAMIYREITLMISPPIKSIYFHGGDHVEHVIDEVDANWKHNCVLSGPRPRPDLALGLSSSAFTSAEIEKLDCYSTSNNWTKFTELMYFPFLMCEVKCGRDGLDTADRQNMHTSSIAIKAILQIEQEADKYRPEKELQRLSYQTLIYSISHDQEDARIYGHFPVVYGEKWYYYRYRIAKLDLLAEKHGLLASHNFVGNVLKLHVPKHLDRLKNAIAILPEPKLASLSASEMESYDTSRQASQYEDAAAFKRPEMPASASVNDNIADLRQRVKSPRRGNGASKRGNGASKRGNGASERGNGASNGGSGENGEPNGGDGERKEGGDGKKGFRLTTECSQ